MIPLDDLGSARLPADGFGRSRWLPAFVLYLDERLRR
jgi:hypothetical protein